MFKVNASKINNLGSSFMNKNSNLMMINSRLALMKAARIVPKRMYTDKNSLMKFVPKRNFN